MKSVDIIPFMPKIGIKSIMEEIEMEATIKLNSPDDVRDFVCKACQCNFDIDIFYNHFIVDAKSLLGVLSMDLTRTLSVSCREYDRDFANTLKKYAVA